MHPELRDAIYEESLERKEVHPKSGLRIEVRGCAPCNMLCTSRQLKQELEDRVGKNMSVHMHDSEDMGPDRTNANSTLGLPTKFTTAKRVHIVLMAPGLSMLRYHYKWIFLVLGQFPSLSELKVKVGIQASIDSFDDLAAGIAEQGWTKFAGLSSLEVFDARSPDVEWKSELWDKEVLCWSRETGEFDEFELV